VSLIIGEEAAALEVALNGTGRRRVTVFTELSLTAKCVVALWASFGDVW
jgi:hypothetical protein